MEEAVVTVVEADKDVVEADKTVETVVAEVAEVAVVTVEIPMRNQNGNPKPTWAAW